VFECLVGRGSHAESRPAPAARFHFGGEILHVLLRDYPAFAMCDGGFRYFDCRKNVCPSMLAVLPKRHRLLYGIFSRPEIGAQYCENCRVGQIVPDNVELTVGSEGVRGYALDPTNAEALWKRSEELVGESF